MTTVEIVSASQLQPGDYVGEYGSTVVSVRESPAYLGVREVTFAGQPGVFYLHFMEWLHVSRDVAHNGPDDDEDDDGQQHDAVRGDSWDW